MWQTGAIMRALGMNYIYAKASLLFTRKELQYWGKFAKVYGISILESQFSSNDLSSSNFYA